MSVGSISSHHQQHHHHQLRQFHHPQFYSFQSEGMPWESQLHHYYIAQRESMNSPQYYPSLQGHGNTPPFYQDEQQLHHQLQQQHQLQQHPSSPMQSNYFTTPRNDCTIHVAAGKSPTENVSRVCFSSLSFAPYFYALIQLTTFRLHVSFLLILNACRWTWHESSWFITRRCIWVRSMQRLWLLSMRHCWSNDRNMLPSFGTFRVAECPSVYTVLAFLCELRGSNVIQLFFLDRSFSKESRRIPRTASKCNITPATIGILRPLHPLWNVRKFELR